jgi:hypothetical protein
VPSNGDDHGDAVGLLASLLGAPAEMLDVTLDQLRTLAVVHVTGSAQRAARVLGREQSSVQKQLEASRPRPRSEGMAPDGAALETSARHPPGVSSQVGTQPSPARALCAFTQVDGTGRSGPAAASPMGRPMVSAGDEVSASLLTEFATASDIGLYRRTGCSPRLEVSVRNVSPSANRDVLAGQRSK